MTVSVDKHIIKVGLIPLLTYTSLLIGGTWGSAIYFGKFMYKQDYIYNQAKKHEKQDSTQYAVNDTISRRLFILGENQKELGDRLSTIEQKLNQQPHFTMKYAKPVTGYIQERKSNGQITLTPSNITPQNK